MATAAPNPPAHTTSHPTAGTHPGTVDVDPGEHGTNFPPFDTHSFASQLLWLAISFGVLYYVMAKLALPRLEGVMTRRANRIGGDLREAESMRAQAQAAGDSYDAAMAEARARAKTIAQDTRDKLGAEADVRRKTLEAELTAKMEAADATIRSGSERAMANVRGIASDTASAIVERLVGRAPDQAALAAASEKVA